MTMIPDGYSKSHNLHFFAVKIEFYRVRYTLTMTAHNIQLAIEIRKEELAREIKENDLKAAELLASVNK